MPSHQYHREDDDDWGGGRAVREYLEAIDEGDAQAGASGGRSHRLSRQPVIRLHRVARAFYAYSTNYLIDTDHGIIMDVEPSAANRAQEAETAKP